MSPPPHLALSLLPIAVPTCRLMPVFKDCMICKGNKKRPRNGQGGRTCSADECKKAYKELRAQQTTVGLDVAGVPPAAGEMPKNMWVKEVEEILGERCCEPHRMSKKKRKNGPGNTYKQQFLVRGTFLEDDGDAEDTDDDETPEPETFWIDKADLLETIDIEDVKEALRKRHEDVLDDL